MVAMPNTASRPRMSAKKNQPASTPAPRGAKPGPPPDREGYKHTKLGWIPEEWEVKKLGSLGSFTKGKGLTKAELTLEGIPCVTYGELYTKHHIAISKFHSFTSTISASQSKRLETNDILFAGSGETAAEIGKCAVFIGDNEAYAGGDVVIFRQKGIDGLYLSLVLNSEPLIHQRARLGQGHSVVHIYPNHLAEQLIALPPEPEQRRIAALLSTWDRAIATVQQLLAAQQLRKQGLMNTVLSDIYHHRHKVTIGDIAVEVSERNTDGTDHIVLSCSKHKGFVSSLEYFKKQVFSEDRSNYKVIRRGQFGFPANHIEEGSIDLLREHEVGLLSPIYVVFEFDHATVNSEFMYYLFKSERYKHIFRTSTNASVDRRGSLRWNDFKNLWVPLPERDEQNRLAKLFAGLDKQIEQTQNYLDHLTTQKRGLMQQLLTGAVRVKANSDETNS